MVLISLSSRYVYLRGTEGQRVTRTIEIKAGLDKPLSLEPSEFNLKGKVTYTALILPEPPWMKRVFGYLLILREKALVTTQRAEFMLASRPAFVRDWPKSPLCRMPCMIKVNEIVL